jgi:hypothetical protein
LGLPELHGEIEQQLAREIENPDQLNKIRRDKENHKGINTSRQTLKEEQ